MELQKRWVEAPTFVDLGQLYQPSALRTNIDGMLAAPATGCFLEHHEEINVVSVKNREAPTIN